jgi:hypothetical protein
MKITITDELRAIFRQIVAENRTVDEWALIEADDYYQTDHYACGFDATEMAFCFSFYDTDKEIWFQLTLEELDDLIMLETGTVNARFAE